MAKAGLFAEAGLFCLVVFLYKDRPLEKTKFRFDSKLR